MYVCMYVLIIVGDEYTKALAEDDLTSEKLLHRVKYII